MQDCFIAAEKDTQGRGRQVVTAGFERGVPSGFFQAVAVPETSKCPVAGWWSHASGNGQEQRGQEVSWREGKGRRK